MEGAGDVEVEGGLAEGAEIVVTTDSPVDLVEGDAEGHGAEDSDEHGARTLDLQDCD